MKTKILVLFSVICMACFGKAHESPAPKENNSRSLLHKRIQRELSTLDLRDLHNFKATATLVFRLDTAGCLNIISLNSDNVEFCELVRKKLDGLKLEIDGGEEDLFILPISLRRQ